MDKFEKLKSLLKPGDVVNDIGGHFIWTKPWTWVLEKAIQHYQRKLFGDDADYLPTHCMLYFAPDKVFSMTTPCGKWETLEERREKAFAVYRYTRQPYSDRHLEIMYQTTMELIGMSYDYGDLLDFMINGLLGYTHVRKINWFELSRKKMVCSTSVRAIQEKLRQTLEAEGDFSFPRLFDQLNNSKWSSQVIDEFERTDVEMTTPGHYANSAWFSGEFEKVCAWPEPE